MGRQFYFFVDVNEDSIKLIKENILSPRKPIVELSFREFDVERAHEIANVINDDCLRLNVVVSNDVDDVDDGELLHEQSISSLQEMLEQKVSKNEAIFAYDLLQIFNKSTTQKDNVLSAIELADKFFKDNY